MSEKIGLIQKATELGYIEYCELFTVKGLDALSLSNFIKQIEYYFIQKWLRESYDIDVMVNPAHTQSGIKFYFVSISEGEKYDVTNWQDLHTKIIEKSSQEIEDNYINHDLFDKYIFEDGFGFKVFEQALEDGLQKALNLINKTK